jgi:hypothetical protein
MSLVSAGSAETELSSLRSPFASRASVVTVAVSSFSRYDEAIIRRDHEVARAAARLELQQRRRIRAEPAGLRVEHELEDLVGAQVRHEGESIVRSTTIACALRAVGITCKGAATRPSAPTGLTLTRLAPYDAPQEIVAGPVEADYGRLSARGPVPTSFSAPLARSIS